VFKQLSLWNNLFTVVISLTLRMYVGVREASVT